MAKSKTPVTKAKGTLVKDKEEKNSFSFFDDNKPVVL